MIKLENRNAYNRIAFNTGILYIQLILQIAVGLFTTRFVLEALGEVDYGIYILVAGVVGLLSILNSNMSNTSMRYLAYSLGSKDIEIVKKTFNTTMYLHLIIGVIVLLLAEIGGFLMFYYFLKIPTDKILDAKILFQFMVLSTFITVISVPYDAVTNAHENILFLSLVDMFGSILTLLLSIYLLYSDGSRLLIYGFSLLLIQVILRLIKQMYSRRHYEECKLNFKKYKDSKLQKEIFSFTGWNLLTNVSAMATTQVRSIIINSFFGVKVNTSEGIGRNVNGYINNFSVGISRAITPQINKSEGAGNRKQMIHLMYIAVRYSLLMFSVVAVPLIFEMHYVLNLWLTKVPEYTVIFCQMALLIQLLDKFTWQIGNAIKAVGKIKKYLLTTTIISIMNIPLACIIFLLGYPPFAICFIELIICLICGSFRLHFGSKIVGLKKLDYLKKVIVPLLLPILFLSCLMFFIINFFPESFLRVVLITLIYVIVSFSFFYLFAMEKTEQDKLIQLLSSLKNKING